MRGARQPWRSTPSAFVPLLIFGWLILASNAAAAKPLDQVIPELFGGVLSTSISPFAAPKDAQRPRVADRFSGLSAGLAASRAQVPIPSSTGAFRFEFDDELDSYVRSSQSLGPNVAERAQTLGARTWAISTAFTHTDFNTLEGDKLSGLSDLQPALSSAYLAKLPPQDRRRASDNLLKTQIDLAFSLDMLFLSAAYGVTDNIDLSLSLSINRAHIHGSANAVILDPNRDEGVYFTYDQPGLVTTGQGACEHDFHCVHDRFDEEAVGTGDIYLRSKWHFLDTEWADLAASAVLTLPTGNAKDFLGFHDPTFTPGLIASHRFGRFSPHLNLGYAFRSGTDVSQATWTTGADFMATEWLTLAGDFLGYHDDKRDGVNDNVVQSAVGFKVNPFGHLVFSGTFQFPLNRDGLRADVTYGGQVEYTF